MKIYFGIQKTSFHLPVSPARLFTTDVLRVYLSGSTEENKKKPAALIHLFMPQGELPEYSLGKMPKIKLWIPT